MCRSILKATLLAIVLLGLSSALLAQQTGSIVGTVADKTGAMIVNAKITLTNAATKDIRHTMTNGEGFFAFSGAVVGDYSVKAEMDGFQAAEISGVHLSPGDRRNLSVSLEVRAAEQSVTVEAVSSQIQIVDSGDLSSTLYERNIKNLALQGRDVTELLKTLPGFNINTSYNGLQNKTPYDTQITTIGSAVGRGFTGNGAPERVGAADLVSDGAHILDPGCNCNATQTINADMVQEVKVSASAYGADSVTGPVVVSAVSKSGSSEYHGGAYLHFRHHAMNSIDYNVGQNRQPKPNDRYWYPGGQISGPVPFTNKKLTFFAGFEYYNQSFPEQTLTSGIAKAMIPTLSERAGLFDPTLPDNAAVCSSIQGWVSGQYRCQPITSIDTINGYVDGITNSDVSAYLAPGGQAMLTMIPLPNHTPTSDAAYNYVKPLLNTNNGYMFHTRADYSFSDSTKLYVSFNQQHELYGSPIMRWWAAGNSIPWLANPSSPNTSRTISGNLVKVFNSTTTNEFLAGLSYMYSPIRPGNERLADRKAQGYPYTYPANSNIMPSIYNSWWTNDLGIPMLLDTGRASYTNRKLQPSISDNFTKIVRTHTLKAGVSWLRSGNREASIGQTNGPNGTAAYSPVWDYNGPGGTQITSAYNPVLDFMLDLTSGFSYAPVTVSDVQSSGWGFYGQDEWKVTRRLSLNFGLRLSHDTPYTDATGKYGASAWTRAWYDADVAAGITNLPGMRWHAKDKSIPLAGRTMDSIFYGPRFGVAFDVFGTGKTVLRGGFGSYYYRDGVGGTSGLTVALGGTPCSAAGANFLSHVNATTCSVSGAPVDGIAVDPRDHTEPRTLTYNFTVSQQLPMSSLLEISYAGSQSDNLLLPNGLQNVNQIPIGAFMNPDPNPASPFYGQHVPVHSMGDQYWVDGYQLTKSHDFYPLTRYNAMNLVRHGAWANYNALQVSWSKQRGALTYNINYTWSKTLGVDKTPDPVNIHNDYGLISQDRTHVLNASYTYEVGNRFHSKPAAVALNGWLVSGITNLQSGAPLPQSFSSNLGLGGTNTYTDSNINSVKPDYYLGTPSYSLMPQLTCDPSTGLKSGQYINPSCFSLPTAPQFDNNGVLIQLGGQGHYQLPHLTGPVYFSSDLSLARTIKITERQNVQVKFNAINFLNHPLKSFDQNNANNINLGFSNGVLPANIVSMYGITNEKFGRRVLELTVKYNF